MEKENDQVITVADLLRVFKKSVLLMLVVALLVGGLFTVYKRATYQPKYTSISTLFILRTGNTASGTQMSAGSEASYAILIINNCIGLMSLDCVFQSVIDELGLTDYSVSSLRTSVSVTAKADTSLLNVRATARTPELAQSILNSYTKHAKIILESPEGFNDSSLVKIPQSASLPKSPSNSVFSLRSVLVAIVAAIAVYLCALVYDLCNDRLCTTEDIVQKTGLSVLGVIPNSRQAAHRYAYAKYGGNGPYEAKSDRNGRKSSEKGEQ